MLADTALVVIWIGLTCYALFGGADFGAGWWDLLAGGSRRGRPARALIEHAIGPVWEANHVWLIFIVVLLWTGFPIVFAAVMSTLYIPLTLAALGIIARGAAFAFRKVSTRLWQQRLFGGCFALSSVVTPFFLGAVAGGIASDRVPPGLAAGDTVTSWVNPTSFLGGALAVLVCAYMAAVFLCGDAARSGESGLVGYFEKRALAVGGVTGALALAGIFVLDADAPRLFHGLTNRALPLVIASVVLGLLSLVLLMLRRLILVRVTAALAVTFILWSWGAAQYPVMLAPDTTVSSAAAHESVLAASLLAMLVGAVLLVPSLWWLYALFQQRPEAGAGSAGSAGPERSPAK